MFLHARAYCYRWICFLSLPCSGKVALFIRVRCRRFDVVSIGLIRWCLFIRLMSEKPETWESQIVLFSIRVYVFIVIRPMASQMRFILILSVFYPFVCSSDTLFCPALTQNIAFYISFIRFFVSRFICESISFNST